jgi:hypothetical protein
VKQLTLTAFLLTALFTSAMRLPATSCPVAGAPIGKACRPGCCANKSCCADSQKNHNVPSPPLAKDSASNYQPVAIVALCLTASVVEFRSIQISPHSVATCVARSAPRLALLCTFLI